MMLYVVLAMFGMLIAFIVLLAIKVRSKRGTKRSGGGGWDKTWQNIKGAVSGMASTKSFDWVGVLLALGGFILAHWLFSTSFSGVYNDWRSSPNFWPMNAAILVMTVLFTQKSKATRVVGWILAILLVFAVIPQVTRSMPSFGNESGKNISTPSLPATARLPAEVVLPIIAECESRGQQFDRYGNVMISPTFDVGKWQINWPLHHEEAEKLKIDLFTEEGNERFARILHERNELRDWEATRSCWEKRLLAKGLAVEAAEPTSVGEHTFKLTPNEPAVIRVKPWHRWDIVSPTVLPETGWPSWSEYRDMANNLVTTIEIESPTEELEVIVRIRPCTSREDCARSQR